MTAPNTSQPVEFRLGFAGVFSKVAPDLLTDGQYRNGQNLMAVQEGAISSRNGSNTLGQYVIGVAGISQIRKLVVTPQTNPTGDLTNPRYMSVSPGLYRSANLAAPPSLVAQPFVGTFPPWEMTPYAAGSSGNPWAFFASGGGMLKDNGSSPYATLRQWGLLPAYGVPTAVTDGGGSNLDGGASGSPAGSQPYDWVTSNFGADTGNFGNPSQSMASNSAVGNGVPLALHAQQAKVTIFGTDDPQVAQIGVFRRGGILTDGIYRLVGYIANPGLGATSVFTDNVPDTDLAFAQTLEMDNDPPVVSTVASPIRGTISALISGNPGRSVYTLTVGLFPGLSQVTRGSLVHFAGTASANNAEDCFVEQVNTALKQITVYTQYTHATGETVEVGAVVQPCTLTIPYQDCVLVAGDPNNPHLLYKSKTGFPEAFPVGRDASGAITQVPVGNPSNGILNMTEFRSAVLLLNVSALYETTILNGSLVPAIRVADKGLLVRDGWCKTEIEVWLVTADGVYSWDGGSFRKRSDGIDPVFHNEQVNGIAPINMAAPFIRMAADSRSRIHLLYQDINGNYARWVCDPQHGDRWIPFTDNGNPIQALYREPDTNGLLVIRESGALNTVTVDDLSTVLAGQTYTSDIWTGSDPRSSGFPIAYSLVLPWFDLGDPTTSKLWEEALLDFDPQLFAPGTYPQPSSMFVDIYIDYSDTPVDTLQIVIPSGTAYQGRTLVSLLPQMLVRGGGSQAFGREARAISFQIRGAAYPTQPTFYRILFRYQITGTLTAGQPTDWTDAGYPYDKRLSVMRVTFDTAGINRQLMLDTMSGINGNNFNEGIAPPSPFTLANPVIDGNGRCTKAFPLPDGIIAKLMRVRPLALINPGQGASQFFKVLDLAFEYEKFPPDIVEFTEPKQFSPQEGVPRVVRLKIDTGGVACGVTLVGDGANLDGPYLVTSSLDDWIRVITPAPNLIARLWKLRLAPGVGGKAQLWPDWSIDVVPEPPLLTYWTSYEINLGVDFFKFIKQAWLKYLAAGGLQVTFASDLGSYSVTLPAHTTRSTERFYLPTIWNAGPNKSKIYRLTVQPLSGTMRFYLDGSGLEYFALGSDRHAAYQQMPLSELVAFQAA